MCEIGLMTGERAPWVLDCPDCSGADCDDLDTHTHTHSLGVDQGFPLGNNNDKKKNTLEKKALNVRPRPSRWE